MYGGFWNLNSFLDRPERISDFYLSAFLAQLQADDYDVFIAGPSLPDPPTERAGPPSSYHTLASLTQPSEKSKPRDKWEEAGVGHSLRKSPSSPQSDFDDDLAVAIAMSLSSRPKETLPPEPNQGEESIRMQVRIQQGGSSQRHQRKFRPDDPAFHVFTWVDELLEEKQGQGYEISYSSTLLDREAFYQTRQSLQEAGFSHSAALSVYFT